ncbi:hypothetical protein ACIG0A_25030 [Streptomyces californicus]|uniref:hypothetical protein n=1 Tax=Streptomyces californicus TaxID=67351 RepID=UPI0037D423A1
MITTEPVGDWTWEVPLSGSPSAPELAMETSATIWDVLNKHELAISKGKAEISIASVNDPHNIRLQENFTAANSETLRSRSPVVGSQPHARIGIEHIFTIRIQCPGVWLESGKRHRAEKLFSIQVEIWKSALLVVTLETYSDAWLTFDTRDRAQSKISEENAHRLSSALAEISIRLNAEVEPGDPNYFATPAVDGFDDQGAEGASYVDPWGTFESSARSRKLRAYIPAGPPAYEEVTDLPVRYYTVALNGQKVGFIWASVGEFAAGYTPRTAAGEDAFIAGKEFIMLFREAHSKNLAPLDALDWLAQRAAQIGVGKVEETCPLEASSLEELEELSGTY